MFTVYLYRVIKLQNFGQFQAFGGKYFQNTIAMPDFIRFFIRRKFVTFRFTLLL